MSRDELIPKVNKAHPKATKLRPDLRDVSLDAIFVFFCLLAPCHPFSHQVRSRALRERKSCGLWTRFVCSLTRQRAGRTVAADSLFLRGGEIKVAIPFRSIGGSLSPRPIFTGGSARAKDTKVDAGKMTNNAVMDGRRNDFLRPTTHTLL